MLSWCKSTRVKQHKKHPEGKKTNQECPPDGIFSMYSIHHLCFCGNHSQSATTQDLSPAGPP